MLQPLALPPEALGLLVFNVGVPLAVAVLFYYVLADIRRELKRIRQALEE